MKFLSRRAHGFIDYLLVVVFLSLPAAAGFIGPARTLCYSLAFIQLLITGFSALPAGMFPLIPARIHETIEVIVGIFLLLAPWLLGFAESSASRNIMLVLGVVMLALFAITDFTPSPVVETPRDRRRRPRPAA